uniref:DUF7841 domain-containing protein n=1 Tax=Siphoviridae sp. ctKNZ79 TaxID=2825440 RepID=A0A8S5U9Q1_9CAUD|nr:MAG TPA: hypothetical protein [Siphoviridae sp. ctKNZ79]
MKTKLREYKAKLEHELSEYLAQPVGTRSMAAVDAMIECWEHVNDMEHCVCHAGKLGDHDLEEWNAHMKNDDGSTGGHWTVAQTTDAAKTAGVVMEHITPEEWNAAMNMMYSDYCSVATRYGCSKVEFYADLAKAFLFDKDGPGPEAKLAAYYHGIVAE